MEQSTHEESGNLKGTVMHKLNYYRKESFNEIFGYALILSLAITGVLCIGATVNVTPGNETSALNQCHAGDVYMVNSGCNVKGLTFDGVIPRLADNSSNIVFEKDIIKNFPKDTFYVGSGTHDFKIINCALSNIVQVYGYPRDNVTVDNNTFDNVWEPVHFAASQGKNMSVSGNVITNANREGIELQVTVDGLKVNNNWVGNWVAAAKGGGHMGLSIATGFGGNIDISGNTILQTGPGADLNVGCAIESFGHNINISNNYCYGWNCLILNGSEPGGLNSTNNTVVGGHLTDYDSVGGAYNIGPVHSSGDHLYTINDPNAPKPGAALVTPVVTMPPPAIPIGYSAVANSIGQIIVTVPSNVPISVYPTSKSPTEAVSLGSGSITIGGLPNTWFMSVIAGSVTLPPIQITGSLIPSSGPSAPIVIGPTTQPVHTITIYGTYKGD